MPPPMPNPTKRMTANPARPVGRYRPGKAVHEEEESSEDDDEEEVQQKPQPKSQSQTATHRPKAPTEDEDDDEEGFVTDDDDDDDDDEPAPTTRAVIQRAPTDSSAKSIPAQIQESTHVPKEELGTSEQEDTEDEDDESGESSSEEEAPQRKFQRPTFIKKTARNPSDTTPATANNDTPSISNPLATASTPEIDEKARRRGQAELLIKDKLERDLLARAAGKKAWDDDDEVDPEAMIDDTDNLDPKAEYLAWYLREVKRRKRDKEAIEAREREIEEKERRRNLSVADREKEDKEYIDNQKEERDQGRGKANYLAKYHHKGAFFQDDAMAEILKKRDIMGAKFADEVSDKSVLPEYMRVRDMTKLGKKGRTRYKDLKNEDTGRFGDEVKRWRGAGDNTGRRDGFGGDLGGMDERFMADDGRDRGPTGANASAVGMRRERRERSRSRSPRRRRNDSHERGESYRPHRRSYSRSRSRSRTPPRRKRSHSPDHARDKRVRVEAVG